MEKKLIGTHTALYIGGGDSGWITESYATCYRTFHKEIILADALKESDWTEWTAAQKTEWENNPPAPALRNDFTIDAEDAGAVLNDSTGYYELNTLTDITESQMRTILAHADGRNCEYVQGGCKMGRTNIPSFGGRDYDSAYDTRPMKEWCLGNMQIEVLMYSRGCGNWEFSIRECDRLRVITRYSSNPALKNQMVPFYAGKSTARDNSQDFFSGCPALEEFRLLALNRTCRLAVNSPKLSFNTVEFLIQNKNNNAVTWTVNPTVYAKLNGDTTNAACAALTEAEREQWASLLTLAESKNITFATTS